MKIPNPSGNIIWWPATILNCFNAHPSPTARQNQGTDQLTVVLACLIPQDVNPQLEGHLIGALNNGATEDEVKAVRGLVIKVCEAAGLKKLENGSLDSWGWREDVANLKPRTKESKL